jgi:hypothetical protein
MNNQTQVAPWCPPQQAVQMTREQHSYYLSLSPNDQQQFHTQLQQQQYGMQSGNGMSYALTQGQQTQQAVGPAPTNYLSQSPNDQQQFHAQQQQQQYGMQSGNGMSYAPTQGQQAQQAVGPAPTNEVMDRGACLAEVSQVSVTRKCCGLPLCFQEFYQITDSQNVNFHAVPEFGHNTCAAHHGKMSLYEGRNIDPNAALVAEFPFKRKNRYCCCCQFFKISNEMFMNSQTIGSAKREDSCCISGKTEIRDPSGNVEYYLSRPTGCYSSKMFIYDGSTPNALKGSEVGVADRDPFYYLINSLHISFPKAADAQSKMRILGGFFMEEGMNDSIPEGEGGFQLSWS